MFKDGKTNNVLGVYAIADNTVYTTLMNGVEKDGDKIKFDGKSYSIDKKVALTFCWRERRFYRHCCLHLVRQGHCSHRVHQDWRFHHW